MKSVFVLKHLGGGEGDHGDALFIGVYSTQQEADAAVVRLGAMPGFVSWPERFCVDEYEIDRDHWTEGFDLENDLSLRLGDDTVIERDSGEAMRNYSDPTGPGSELGKLMKFGDSDSE